jgi:hypothetical protein
MASLMISPCYQLGSIMMLVRTQFEISKGNHENGKNHYQKIYKFYLLTKGNSMKATHYYNHT